MHLNRLIFEDEEQRSQILLSINIPFVQVFNCQCLPEFPGISTVSKLNRHCIEPNNTFWRQFKNKSYWGDFDGKINSQTAAKCFPNGYIDYLEFTGVFLLFIPVLRAETTNLSRTMPRTTNRGLKVTKKLKLARKIAWEKSIWSILRWIMVEPLFMHSWTIALPLYI